MRIRYKGKKASLEIKMEGMRNIYTFDGPGSIVEVSSRRDQDALLAHPTSFEDADPPVEADDEDAKLDGQGDGEGEGPGQGDGDGDDKKGKGKGKGKGKAKVTPKATPE